VRAVGQKTQPTSGDYQAAETIPMDNQKNQILIAVLVFSLIVMVYQIVFNSGDDFSFLGVLIAMAIGGVAAVAAFFIAGKMNK
jgi:hypothetical protein